MKKLFAVVLICLTIVMCSSVAFSAAEAVETMPAETTIAETTVAETVKESIPVIETVRPGAVIVITDTEAPSTTAATTKPTTIATADEAKKLSTDVATGAGTSLIMWTAVASAFLMSVVCFLCFRKKSKDVDC